MPLPEVVGVVALVGVACRRPEVTVVAGGARRIVLVVANGRFGACLVASPGGIVAVSELGGCVIFVGMVSSGEDCPQDAVQEGGGGLITGAGTAGYVPRADQDRITLGRGVNRPGASGRCGIHIARSVL